MPPARKWERIEDLAVLPLYRGKVAKDSREVAALAAALERSRQSMHGQAFAGLDPANPYKPSSWPRLTQSVWAEYLADRTAIAVEGQRAYLGILNRRWGRP